MFLWFAYACNIWPEGGVFFACHDTGVFVCWECLIRSWRGHDICLIVVGFASSSLAKDLAALVSAKGRAFGRFVHIDISRADRGRVRVCTLMVMELS